MNNYYDMKHGEMVIASASSILWICLKTKNNGDGWLRIGTRRKKTEILFNDRVDHQNHLHLNKTYDIHTQNHLHLNKTYDIHTYGDKNE